MAIQFKIFTIPEILTLSPEVAESDVNRISMSLRKSNRKLIRKMEQIDLKEKHSWQKSLFRN